MEILTQILGVIYIDLILSGDNALVIGTAVSRLEPKTGKRAAAFGVGLAAAMRITFIIIISFLMKILWIRVVGGVLIFYVTYKLFLSIKEVKAHHTARSGKSIFDAIFVIVLADLSLSLDNVLIIAAIAQDNLLVVVIGILFSIAFMFISAQLLATLIRRYPWIIFIACGILLYVGIGLIDEGLGLHYLKHGKESLWSFVTKLVGA